MLARNIKQAIYDKMSAWLDSIEDDNLKKLLKKNIIVTGGSITSMLLNDHVKDFDVYFRTREAAVAAALYYVGKFQNTPMMNGQPVAIYVANGFGQRLTDGGSIHPEEQKKAPTITDQDFEQDGEGGRYPVVQQEVDPIKDKQNRVQIVVKSAGIASEEDRKTYYYFEGQPLEDASNYVGQVFGETTSLEKIADMAEEMEEKAMQDTSPASTLPKFRPVFLSTNAVTLSDRVQLIFRFFGEPDEIHKNYDFVHCTNYWSSWDNKLELRPEAVLATMNKELRYTGSKYPICSMIRIRKFVGRGWTINAGQVLKMALQVSKLDLTRTDVLRDQLTGVDVAYFAQMLTLAESKDPHHIDQAYLVEIIDRMF